MRALSELEIRILDMIEPVAKAQGLEVVRVRVMGSQTPTLQIMAEKPDGTMSVANCAKFSRALNSILETEDPIAGEYALEVSSPGIDRPLTREGDFAKWVGHEVKIELAMATPEGRKRFHGFIEGEDKDGVGITLKDGGAVKLAVGDMVKAHLVLTDKLIQDARKRGAAPAQDLAEGETPEEFDEVEEDAEDGDEDPDDADDDEEFESEDDEDFEDDEDTDEDEEASASHKKE
ncbi:MAG TPA: ribosome maturation factor RimP [Hyphomonadaceae bacterium]|jgi:ribosome maturation factor RimP|nr:ribosome maturation factor RimP [Hyphomonadaceae bacterium]